jgi:phage terminase Nu1 subunit (DNA packaging protein)
VSIRIAKAGETQCVCEDKLRTLRAGVLAAPVRCQQRLPHLTAHDVSELDLELRAVLTELSNGHGG